MAINWQDVITTVGVTTGGGSVLLGASAWLIKKVLTSKLERDAVAFKIQLKADADQEIEKLKASLQIISAEHQVRFSKLHDKRAEVIAELYKRLVQVFWRGQMFVLTSENNPTAYQKAEFAKTEKEVRELFFFFDENRIYLPESVCTLLDKFIGEIRGNVYAAGIFGRIENPNEHTSQQSQDAFTKGYEAFEKQIPAARRVLETEFRGILGVEKDKSA